VVYQTNISGPITSPQCTSTSYQPGTHLAGPKIASTSVCASTLIMCAIITSCTLLPYDSYEFEIPRRRGNLKNEVDREQKCHKEATTRDAYRAANPLRMAARRALEWIRMPEGPNVV